MVLRLSVAAVCAVAVALLCAVSVSAQPGLVYSSDSEMTRGADPVRIRCEVCQAVLRTLAPQVKAAVPRKYKGGRTVVLMGLVEEVCTPDSFRVYEFSPPDMIEACRAFRSEYEDDLEEIVTGKVVDELKWRQSLCGRKEICPKGLWEVTQSGKDEEKQQKRKEAADWNRKATEHNKRVRAEDDARIAAAAAAKKEL